MRIIKIAMLIGFGFTFSGNVRGESITASETGQTVELKWGTLPLVTYWKSPGILPAGVDAIYEREAYLHPVRALTGETVTGDFPADHPHQRGLFFAWTNTVFNEDPADFSDLKKGTASIEHRKVLEIDESGGAFRVEHAHVAGDRVALIEEWEVSGKIIEAGKSWALDITSKQRLAGPHHLDLLKDSYGGMSFRGSDQWIAGCKVLTSSGDDRSTAGDTQPVWVSMSGTVDGKIVTVIGMGSPNNPRYVQPVGVHPEVPYFCFSPSIAGAFAIKRNETYVSRYRYIIVSGAADKGWIDIQWRAYQEEQKEKK